MQIPLPLAPISLSDDGTFLKRPTHRSARPFTSIHQNLVKEIILGAADLLDYSSIKQIPGTKNRQQFIDDFLRICGCRLVNVNVPSSVDTILVSKPELSSYRNTLDLWEAMNEISPTLLLSPGAPPYGFNKKLSHLLIVGPDLGLDNLSSAIFWKLSRSIIRNTPHRLLVIRGWEEAPYFYDLLSNSRSIIYDDCEIHEPLMLGRHLFKNDGADWQTLQELFIDAECSAYGVTYAKAMYRAALGADQIWLWTYDQYVKVLKAVPEVDLKCLLIGPHIDVNLLNLTKPQKCDYLLFSSAAETCEQALSNGLRSLLQAHEAFPPELPVEVIAPMSIDDRKLFLARKNRRIQESVSRSQMFAYFQGARAYCRVTTKNSLPLSVLEAMACKTPVIISPQVARNADFFAHGTNCLVVRPDDPAGFIEAVRLLTNEPARARRLGEEARYAVSGSSFRSLVNKVFALY